MEDKKPALQVPLNQLNQLAEIILRAGMVDAGPTSIRHLIARYEIDARYDPPIYGLSTVFRQGASFTELARNASFPNNKISVSIVNMLIRELAKVHHEVILYATPTDRLPDHHTLGVVMDSVPQATLTERVARALIKAFFVVDNPFKP